MPEIGDDSVHSVPFPTIGDVVQITPNLQSRDSHLRIAGANAGGGEIAQVGVTRFWQNVAPLTVNLLGVVSCSPFEGDRLTIYPEQQLIIDVTEADVMRARCFYGRLCFRCVVG